MDLVEATHPFAGDATRHPWEAARLEVVRKLIDRHARLLPGSVVVDIGCGDAFVSASLAARFPHTTFYAVDPAFTDQMLALGLRNGPANLQLLRRLDDLSLPPARTASLVLLMDVIEHIENDGAFLDDLATRGFVDAGTCVLVTVPAYQWLFTAHDVFLKHYRRYSNRTLRSRLERSGYRVEAIGYFFLSMLPVRLWQFAREKALGHHAVTATGLGGAPGAGSALLKQALVADATVALALGRIGVTLPGLSNFAICRMSA